VTTPNASLRQLVGDSSKLWVDAAEQSDTLLGLGMDDRIKLGHSLVDLWVKTYIALIQAWIGGPSGGGPGSSMASEPLPSEVIDVAPRNYPRQITADGPFVRVGLPKIKIPKSAIAFQPAFLPAGVTQFRIVLKDYRFIGANYTGSVTLAASAGMAGLSPTDLVNDQKVVTVGL
jgi:hypothetical protein